MSWRAVYDTFQRSGLEASQSATPELAIDHACELMRQGHWVRRVIGPRGEVIELPEIKRRYQELYGVPGWAA
jgi:hypothetical protein